MKKIVMGMLTCVMLWNVPEAAGQRKGFIIGFGMGPGYTSFAQTREAFGGTFVSDRETKLTLMTDFKIGYAPTDALALYWMSKVAWFSEDALVTHGYGGLGATYPLTAVAPDLFVNGGIGFASWQTPLEEGAESEMGLGLVGGIEYEFSKHWIFDVDLLWGRPSKDQIGHRATSLKFTVNYLHY